jgi:hypothetical protein
MEILRSPKATNANLSILRHWYGALVYLQNLDIEGAWPCFDHRLLPYKKNKIKTKIQTTFDKKENPLRKSKPFAPRNLPFKTEESKRWKVESNISDTAPLQSERQCDWPFCTDEVMFCQKFNYFWSGYFASQYYVHNSFTYAELHINHNHVNVSSFRRLLPRQILWLWQNKQLLALGAIVQRA